MNIVNPELMTDIKGSKGYKAIAISINESTFDPQNYIILEKTDIIEDDAIEVCLYTSRGTKIDMGTRAVSSAYAMNMPFDINL
jgi:hypothetical protein